MSQQAAPKNILPRANMAGASLGAVTMVMSFLACLAVGAALLVSISADHWLARATSAMTVQISDTDRMSADDQRVAVMRELAQFPGVTAARPLTSNDMIELLEPWLGTGNVSDDLPLPVLIEITPDAQLQTNAEALDIALRSVAPGARLDTHGRWRETLTQTTTILRIFAGLVLLMVTLATITVLIFAIRAGLMANAEILQVLHQIGAHDRFIAWHFEQHFLRLTFLWAFLGAILAGSLFLALGEVMVELQHYEILIWLVPVPFGFCLLGWIVTRRHVLHSLTNLM
jgi:cell division transport system permease protein